MSMTQEQINVDLFDQVKKLQDIKRRHEAEVLTMAQENDQLRGALEKYRGQIDNEGKHSAADALSLDNTKSSCPDTATKSNDKPKG